MILRGLSNPTAANDAATKQYVDDKLGGDGVYVGKTKCVGDEQGFLAVTLEYMNPNEQYYYYTFKAQNISDAIKDYQITLNGDFVPPNEYAIGPLSFITQGANVNGNASNDKVTTSNASNHQITIMVRTSGKMITGGFIIHSP